MSQIYKAVTAGNLPPTVFETITGNDFIQEAAVNHNFNIVTANSTPKFLGSTATETLDFGLDNLLLGTTGPAITSATQNVSLGRFSLPALISGNANTAIGYDSLNLLNTGSSNTSVGVGTLDVATSSGQNSAFGVSALGSLTTSVGQNTAIGVEASGSITTGRNSISLGFQAGNSHTTSDSSNIDIGNSGTVGESNTIRIGTQGTGTGQQSRSFIAGVFNTVSGRVVKITSPGAYPYLTLTTDYLILVDTASARTINLIASPVTGTTYRIKDNVGSAAANNITITPNAGNIDGAASYIMSTNYGSVDMVYNGTKWNVL